MSKSFIFVYKLSKFENLLILTPNDPKYPRFSGHMTSGDLGTQLLLISASRPSFWYIICQGLKIFVFWPQMTVNTPDSWSNELGWPGQPLFCNQGNKSFILIYKPSRFESVWILTPNDPKYPQVTPTPNLKNKKPLSGPKLQFELSQALIGSLNDYRTKWLFSVKNVYFRIFIT